MNRKGRYGLNGGLRLDEKDGVVQDGACGSYCILYSYSVLEYSSTRHVAEFLYCSTLVSAKTLPQCFSLREDFAYGFEKGRVSTMWHSKMQRG